MSKKEKESQQERKRYRQIAKDYRLQIAIMRGELERIECFLLHCPLCQHFDGFNEYDEAICCESGKKMIVYEPRNCPSYTPYPTEGGDR